MPKSKRTAKLNEDVKIDWKPWLRNVTEPTALSHERMHNITVGSRWAFSLMQRTRAELIRVHTEIIDPDGVDAIMRLLAETRQWLSATEHMVAAAHERVLASAEAAHAKGLKFKGVVDLDGPAPRRKAVQGRVAKSPGDTCMSERETYLGDGLYASFDGWQVKLRAPRENGDDVVFLEDGLTLQAFFEFLDTLPIKIGASNGS